MSGSHADGYPPGCSASDVERANREVVEEIDYGNDNGFGCEARRIARMNAHVAEPMRSILNAYYAGYAAAVSKEAKS